MSRLCGPTANELKPPIILIGNVRSGTSMIQDLFAIHPEIVPWFEPRTVWTYADPSRRHDRFDRSDASPRVVQYIRRRFLGYQRSHDNRRIMEKTPSNIMRIPYVRAVLPEAKYLYIVREPLANLSSSELKWRLPIHRHKLWRRLKETPKSQLHHYAARYLIDHTRIRLLKRRHVSVWGVRYPGIYEDLKTLTAEQVIAKQWIAACQQAREDLAGLDENTVMQIRYEDFVEKPKEIFPRILEHFDLPMTMGIETELSRRIDPNRRQKWRRLDNDVVKTCLPILREEMARHGYETPDEYRETGDS